MVRVQYSPFDHWQTECSVRRNVPNLKVSSCRFKRLVIYLPTNVGQIVVLSSWVDTFAETLTIASTGSSLIGHNRQTCDDARMVHAESASHYGKEPLLLTTSRVREICRRARQVLEADATMRIRHRQATHLGSHAEQAPLFLAVAASFARDRREGEDALDVNSIGRVLTGAGIDDDRAADWGVIVRAELAQSFFNGSVWPRCYRPIEERAEPMTSGSSLLCALASRPSYGIRSDSRTAIKRANHARTGITPKGGRCASALVSLAPCRPCTEQARCARFRSRGARGGDKNGQRAPGSRGDATRPFPAEGALASLTLPASN